MIITKLNWHIFNISHLGNCTISMTSIFQFNSTIWYLYSWKKNWQGWQHPTWFTEEKSLWKCINTFYPELYFFGNSSCLAIFGNFFKKMMGTLTIYLIYADIYSLSHKCRELWQEVLVNHFRRMLIINYAWMTSRGIPWTFVCLSSNILLRRTQRQVSAVAINCYVG